MNLYLKLFLVMGVPFGMCMGLTLQAVGNGNLWFGPIAGVSFGAIMSLFLGTIQKLTTKMISDELGNGPRYTKTVCVDASFESIFDKSLVAIESIGGRVTSDDKESGVISAKTKLSFSSFGEKIQISVAQNESGKNEVTVLSEPSLKYTLVDYGKGGKNVMSIVSSITTLNS